MAMNMFCVMLAACVLSAGSDGEIERQNPRREQCEVENGMNRIRNNTVSDR